MRRPTGIRFRFDGTRGGSRDEGVSDQLGLGSVAWVRVSARAKQGRKRIIGSADMCFYITHQWLALHSGGRFARSCNVDEGTCSAGASWGRLGAVKCCNVDEGTCSAGASWGRLGTVN